MDEEEEEGFYLIRPGALKFLFELNQLYDIVIFTAAVPEYANWIIDSIDPDGYVSHRLYRQHTTPCEDYALKDITKLGRALNKTLIIDNIEDNFKTTSPHNGIHVMSWFDEMDDRVLEILSPFLKQIVRSKVEDVRTLIKNFGKTVQQCLTEGRPIPEFSSLDLIEV